MSIPLSANKVLWLFGDTFVPAQNGAGLRVIENSVGIQVGRNPATANFVPFVRDDPDTGGVAAFFSFPREGEWLWPLSALIVPAGMLCFFMRARVRSSRVVGGDHGPLAKALDNFELVGWRAAVVSNWRHSPAEWAVEWIQSRDIGPWELVGTGLIASGDWVYGYTWAPGARGCARWPLHLPVGRGLGCIEYWSEEMKTWTGDASSASVIFEGAMPEMSIHWSRGGDRLIQVESVDLEGGLRIRGATQPQGPWVEIGTGCVPGALLSDYTYVYAAKAHSHLSTGKQLVVSVVVNANDPLGVIFDSSIYMPQFLLCPFKY